MPPVVVGVWAATSPDAEEKFRRDANTSGRAIPWPPIAVSIPPFPGAQEDDDDKVEEVLGNDPCFWKTPSSLEAKRAVLEMFDGVVPDNCCR